MRTGVVRGVISPWVQPRRDGPLAPDTKLVTDVCDVAEPPHRHFVPLLIAAAVLGGCAAMPMPAPGQVVTQVAPSLLESAENAKQSVWLEAPSLQDRKLMQALQQAHDRGVQVNVILTRSSANLGAAMRFSDPLTGVPFRFSDTPLTHTLAIIDGTTAFTEQGPQPAKLPSSSWISGSITPHVEPVVRPSDTWSMR